MVRIEKSIYLNFLSKFGVGGAHPGGIQLTKELFKAEKITPGTRILDVGCGTGQTAAYLAAQYGAIVTGIDINPVMVEKAKARMARSQLPVKIIQGSIEECPLKDEAFDLILSESVLAFVHKLRALAEILRLLKGGGRFIANELTLEHPIDPGSKEEITRFYGLDSLLMERDWLAFLQQAGFKGIRIRKQDPSFQQNPIPEFYYSNYIEPELYPVLNQHVYIMAKYQNVLGHRVYVCTK
ncbi:class I SAM-dependent methyltransferase [Bacillus sp. FJAT-27251]|uniref:class I SAM-dependent methyltransferase n=1 Tax=Bacillus sp. FJAT-27251 TaxID=1684142 RepID=UPI0009E549F1|nr:class I SAM-dependent methyltransferase [Bacillus sp. FJAT-27251]